MGSDGTVDDLNDVGNAERLIDNGDVYEPLEYRQRGGPERSHDEEPTSGVQPTQVLKERDAVCVGKPQVQDGKIEGTHLRRMPTGRFAVTCLQHVVAGGGERRRDRPADQRLIIDD